MKMLRIGLTGGIASGKSAVAALFAGHGVPVIDTDEIARDIVKPGMPALQRLVQVFGNDMLDTVKALDRRRLRAVVFSDPTLREQLEQMLHPPILEEMERRSATAGGPYQILVVPLLVETNARYVDRVLVVDCPPELQLRRLMQRDSQTEAQAQAILAAQASREERLQRADDIITNDADLEALAVKVAKLHRNYLALARNPPSR